MFGIRRAMIPPPNFSIDHFRAARERMPPVTYLSWSYYDHWYFVTVLSLLQADMVSIEELVSGKARSSRVKADGAPPSARATESFRTGGKFDREASALAAFSVGQDVKTRNLNPPYHTRLPGYARGKRGVVVRCHGAHVFPDTNARGEGERPQHLYTVTFSARELWGQDVSKNDKVYLDLWESYLDVA